MKKNGIDRALEYGKSLKKELSPKIHYVAGYNQAAEDYNNIEADAIQDFLSTEIMVLREKNDELVEMLKKYLSYLESFNSDEWKEAEEYLHFMTKQLINSNITE